MVLGDDCSVRGVSAVLPGASLASGAVVGPGSMCLRGAYGSEAPPPHGRGRKYRGNPARPATRAGDDGAGPWRRRRADAEWRHAGDGIRLLDDGEGGADGGGADGADASDGDDGDDLDDGRVVGAWAWGGTLLAAVAACAGGAPALATAVALVGGGRLVLRRRRPAREKTTRRRVAALFGGESWYPGAAADLWLTSPAFRRAALTTAFSFRRAGLARFDKTFLEETLFDADAADDLDARTRNAAAFLVQYARPRRTSPDYRLGSSSPRKCHAAAAAPPRLISENSPRRRRGRGAAAIISEDSPRRRGRDSSPPRYALWVDLQTRGFEAVACVGYSIGELAAAAATKTLAVDAVARLFAATDYERFDAPGAMAVATGTEEAVRAAAASTGDAALVARWPSGTRRDDVRFGGFLRR